MEEKNVLLVPQRRGRKEGESMRGSSFECSLRSETRKSHQLFSLLSLLSLSLSDDRILSMMMTLSLKLTNLTFKSH